MALRNVILVAYHFPPMGGSGVQRPLKWAKYLPASGWRPHVVCAGHQHYPVLDESLESEIGPNVPVHRIPGWEPAGLARRISSLASALLRSASSADIRRFEDRVYWRLERWAGCLPCLETEAFWTGSAARLARRLSRDAQVECVVTTSPPHSVHRVGLRLKRRGGLAWIADLRDPITDNFGYDATGRRHRGWVRLESQIVAVADRIIVTCEDYAQRLASRYPDARGRIVAIPNGFDPDDAPKAALPRRQDRFRLANVGAFYSRQTIAPILDAIRRLRDARPDAAAQIELRLVGTLSASQRAHLRKEDSAFITEAGYRCHRDAVAEMASADALLLATPDSPGGRLCVPAKTFEYLAFGKHVIAAAHPGSHLDAILRRAGGCTITHVAHGDSPRRDASADGWRRAIESAFEAWTAGRLDQRRDGATVERFRRDLQARRLADLLDAVALRRGTGISPAIPPQPPVARPTQEAVPA